MPNYQDTALNFECAGETLFGVLSQPLEPANRAVLLIVGGPQYRVGSHRQFVQMARALAAAGFPVLRFDYRGMGDSGGGMRDFEHIDDDIRAAADALMARCPQVQDIVLWGLCDAASAACMYAPRDARVSGLILLNPWVRNTASYARTQVKHYYGARLFRREFWNKLLRGEVRLLQSARESAGTVLRTLGKSTSTASVQAAFQTRMLQGLQQFSGRILLLISGRDLTAREFTDMAGENGEWRTLLDNPCVRRAELTAADHTFSNMEWKEKVETLCIEWLQAPQTSHAAQRQ